MQSLNQHTNPEPDQLDTGVLDLFPLLLLLRTHLRRTLLCTALGLVIAAGFAFTRHPRFSAQASILIPATTTTASGLAAQAVAGLGLSSPGLEVYNDILKSHTVADRVIQNLGLLSHYRVHSVAAAEGILKERTTSATSREGMLTVTVEDEDPKLVADLANNYFAELNRVNAQLASATAGDLRRYYASELARERLELTDSELALQHAQEKTGILEPRLQVGSALSAEDSIRTQLRSLQVQLQGVLAGATPQSPQAVRLQAEISGLEGQLREQQSGGGNAVGTPMAKQPALSLDLGRLERDVKYREALLELINRQYEAARQQEEKDVSTVQILDAARPPLGPSWPDKPLWLAVGAIAGLFLGLLFSVLQGLAAKVLSNPVNRQRLHTLTSGLIPGSSVGGAPS